MSSTQTRTPAQASFLNRLSTAADNMRASTKVLAAQAKEASEFTGEANRRPDIYAQYLVESVERIAALNMLLDLAGGMGVSQEDFVLALGTEDRYFTTDN